MNNEIEEGLYNLGSQIKVLKEMHDRIEESSKSSILALGSRVAELEKKTCSGNSETTDLLMEEVSELREDFKSLRNVCQSLGRIIEQVAIEKKLIAPPKEKTAEEKLKEEMEKLNQEVTQPTDPEPESSKIGYCLACRKYNPMINAKRELAKTGSLMLKGECKDCGQRIARKIKQDESV